MSISNQIENKKYIDSKCLNCGSELKFLPGSKKVECISCGSTFDINSLGSGKLQSEEVDYAKALEEVKKSSIIVKKQRTIHCQDCGSLIYLSDKAVSVICPFCNSNRVIQEDKENEIIKINGVIPFQLNESDVKVAFQTWIKNKFFAPGKFKKGKIVPSFSGFYIPFYTFDSKTFSTYTANRGDYYYVTRTVRSGNTTRTIRERHTRWTRVSGKVSLNFDDVLVNGSNNQYNDEVNKIAHFDFNKMEKYQEKFLLGYYTEKPSLTLEEGFSVAKNNMMSTIRNECIKNIGGDTYSNLNFQTTFSNVTFKQIMVPIYNGNYTYLNKNYHFMCNAQTGKFAGKYPISSLKITLLVISILLLITAILLLAYFFTK